mmetsp:Transcript_183/g.461  ORF Transcript_183/g.461 Transcript_183/m.461 type:complete len:246 (+) Transcript_183:17-754(+)
MIWRARHSRASVGHLSHRPRTATTRPCRPCLQRRGVCRGILRRAPHNGGLFRRGSPDLSAAIADAVADDVRDGWHGRHGRLDPTALCRRGELPPEHVPAGAAVRHDAVAKRWAGRHLLQHYRVHPASLSDRIHVPPHGCEDHMRDDAVHGWTAVRDDDVADAAVPPHAAVRGPADREPDVRSLAGGLARELHGRAVLRVRSPVPRGPRRAHDVHHGGGVSRAGRQRSAASPRVPNHRHAHHDATE